LFGVEEVSGHNFKAETAVPLGGGVTGVDMKVAETCAGRFVRVKSTGELNLPIESTVIVMFPHWPWLTTRGVGAWGLAVIVKSDAGVVTVRVTPTLRVMSGRVEVPVIVRLYDPMGVVNEVGIIRVEVTVPPELGVTEEGTMLAVTPGGKPAVTWREIAELKLPTEVTAKL
jgi:hypothetical protein